MKRLLLYILVLVSAHQMCFAQTTIRGRVVSSQDLQALPGTSIKLKGSSAGVSADTSGNFMITVPTNGILVVSFIGFATKEVDGPFDQSLLLVKLDPAQNSLAEIVVSTGYQELPKERATGSFVHIDKELLNRSVGTDVLSRLQDVVPGMTFNRVGRSQISIRGQSTIFANAEPLIVLDNFPYDGDIRNINPNDIESVTVLKDAAAASIWGARAGNGVIVINTRKTASKTSLSFNSNISIGEKPDLFYQPRMSSAEFIEMEKVLFGRGYYTSAENSAWKEPLTPVVELLIAKRDGQISPAEADRQIEALKTRDVRTDFSKYFHQPSSNQQYSLGLKGGAENHRYAVAGGYDKNLSNNVGDEYSRVTLSASNTYALLNKRLEVLTELIYNQSSDQQNGQNLSSIRMSTSKAMYPYARLVDDSGNPLPLVKDFRAGYAASAPQTGLLNWQYNPLGEVGLNNHTIATTNYLLNSGIKFKATQSLSGQVLYQFGKTLVNRRNLYGEESYYTRNLINQFSSVNSNGSIFRPIPIGDIIDHSASEAVNHNLRGQLNYSKLFRGKHQLSGILGSEIKDLHFTSNTFRNYGYDSEHASGAIVDYIGQYPLYYFPASTARIQNLDSSSDLTDRFLSWYTNAAYAFSNRYVVTASARLDRSNLFGVATNQKGIPLWSAGLGWNLFNERFYTVSWLPYLKLSATYGYSGNIDKSVSALTTARIVGTLPTNEQYAAIVNPPNPELRWERVRLMNLAADFETSGGMLSGRLEYYSRKAEDLIGSLPLAPSTGMTQIKGNSATTRSHGVDISLNSRQVNRAFKWFTTVLFSYEKNRVTEYAEKAPVTAYLQGIITSPLQGRPLYSVYSYPWAGLDPQTGDPMGYLNGVASKDYSKIITAATPENIVFHGSARPTIFGAFRNTFSYKKVSVSANISYRIGYYFRRNSVNYNAVLTAQGSHGDYSSRWQKPGDEQYTNVPSMPSMVNNNRDNLYLYSSALVDKADHIRLKDVNVSYRLEKADLRALPVNLAEIYLYLNNLGMLYHANKAGIDPDFQNLPLARTIALGLKIDL